MGCYASCDCAWLQWLLHLVKGNHHGKVTTTSIARLVRTRFKTNRLMQFGAAHERESALKPLKETQDDHMHEHCVRCVNKGSVQAPKSRPSTSYGLEGGDMGLKKAQSQLALAQCTKGDLSVSLNF